MTTAALTAVAHASHADGLTVFDGVLGVLERAGWTRLRVDTLVHPDTPLTVRHHYSAGRWELHLEPDPLHVFRGQASRGSVRIAYIDRWRALPTVGQVVDDLFGDRLDLSLPPTTGNGTPHPSV